jgi:sugar phosphate isomerase/epimerase
MNRRSFLWAMAAPLALPTLRRAGPANGRLPQIGLQLYTVRDLMQADVGRTLEQVAAVGYEEVEFAGYFGTPPAQIRALLDSAGLRSPSAHIPLGELRDDPGRLFDAAEVIGHRYIVVPSLDPPDRRTIDDFRRVAAELNRAGESARARGLRVGYHNHDFELSRIGGTLPYDVLLAETDPALVWFEMDFYWMTNGGADPVAYLDRYPGRFHLCHIKDRDPSGRMTDVGDGRIDFHRILSRRERAGLRHFFVERDDPPRPMDSIRRSWEYLHKLEV